MTEGYRELAYNGSGYYDDTAYRAFMNLKEDKKEMMDAAMGGDIWLTQTGNDKTQEALILASHDNYVTVLRLTEKQPFENAVKIHSKSLMWADVGKICWTYTDNLLEFVKSVSDEEYQSIMDEVVSTLTVELSHTSEQQVVAAVKAEPSQPSEGGQVAETSSQPSCFDSSNTNLQTAYRQLEIELAKAEKERDIYKELFYKAFPQMGGAA